MSQTISGTYKLPPMMSGLVGSPYGAYSYPVKTAPIEPITPQINYNTSNINANIPRPSQFTNQPTPYVPRIIPEIFRETATQVINSTPNITPEKAEQAKLTINKILELGLTSEQLYAIMKEYALIPDNSNKPSFIDFIGPYLSRFQGQSQQTAGRRRRYRSTKKGRKNRKH